VEAPWRSLIYRNVDTPFSYEDDSTIFPHMPRDTPGYDCRARRILGDWMISIPALWRSEQEASPQVDLWGSDLTSSLFGWWITGFGKEERPPNNSYTRQAAFADPQPYVEARADEPGRLRALIEAEERLKVWHATGRYTQCPDPNLDIVDSYIVHGDRTVPTAEADFPLSADQSHPGWGGLVPQRPHWFVMDLTQPSSAWQPRRTDWVSTLRDGIIPVPGTVAMLDAEERRARNDRTTVYLLTGKDPWRGKLSPPAAAKGLYEYPEGRVSVGLTPEFRSFALAPQPMGLWRDKPECSCKLASQPKVGDARFAGATHPGWFDQALFDGERYAPAPEAASVYSIAPGAQVFNSVCANCHGPKADARGRMADTIADLTGGDTQVANLRDGFFGPAGAAGEARRAVFGAVDGVNGAGTEDWAARYLLWMGLGGTQRKIPQPVLNVVATTRVFGLKREGLEQLSDVGANMLAVPEFLCSQTAKGATFDARRGVLAARSYYPRGKDPKLVPSIALFATNGDAEFWKRLCSGEEPFPYLTTVGLARDKDGNPTALSGVMTYRRSGYPAGARVGNGPVIQANLEDDNAAPWCLDLRRAQDRDVILKFYREARGDDAADPPVCPDSFLSTDSNVPSADERAFWARRGAMNAGMAVFVYLDALARGEVEPSVEYDQCEKLADPRTGCVVQP
jgi:mono/diheme cytochrome c family protein